LDGNDNGFSQGSPFDDFNWSFKTEDPYPPQVAGNSPVGSDVPVNSPITITFSEEMDETSVENAITISSGTWGIPVWTDNTITYWPLVNLENLTGYNITINGTIAKDLEGNTLDGDGDGVSEGWAVDSFSWTFTTDNGTDLTPPQVTVTTPANGSTGVAPLSSIIITFSEAMNHTAVEANFNYTPQLEGEFSWEGYDPLIPNVIFDFVIYYNATDLNGNQLDGNMNGVADNSSVDNYNFSFTVGGTKLPVWAWLMKPIGSGVQVNTTIIVNFSSSMDNVSVQNAFMLVPSVTGTFNWSVNNTGFEFTPDSDLDYNTYYLVKITGDATNETGEGLDGNMNFLAEGTPVDDRSWGFSTVLQEIPSPPTVLNHFPTGADVPNNITAIYIVFSEYMYQDSVEQGLWITPSMAGSFFWAGNILYIYLSGNLTPWETYTVFINGSIAMDLEGETLDGNDNGMSQGSPIDDYEWSFSTVTYDETPPKVISNTPTGTSVDVSSYITVTFDELMDKSSAQSAFTYTDGFTIFDGSTGNFSWSGNTMRFIPSLPFNHSTTYTVTINTTTMDKAGNTLDGNGNGISEDWSIDSYSWQFRTVDPVDITLPFVISVSPLGNEIEITATIMVIFNESMDQMSVENAFTITDGSTIWDSNHGSFIWDTNYFTFIPSFEFDYNTTYTVRINITAQDLSGNQLDGNANGTAEDYTIDAYSWDFKTLAPPEIIISSILVDDGDATNPSMVWYLGTGEVAIINATAKNIGFNTTGASFYISLYNVTGPTGGKIPADMAFNQTVGALPQGVESGIITWNWEAPIQSGHYYVNITVDYGEDISELVEENNSFTLHFAVVPDLTVTEVTVDGLPLSAYPQGVVVFPGQIISIGANTTNTGLSGTGIQTFNMSFWNCTQSGVNQGPALINVSSLGPLDSGASTSSQSALWQSPKSTFASEYYINISADSAYHVSEVNENNNRYILQIKVDAPDLAPDFVELKVNSSGDTLEAYADPVGRGLVSSVVYLPVGEDLDIVFDIINLGGMNQSLGTNVTLYNTSVLGGDQQDPSFYQSPPEYINLSAFGLPNDQTSEAGQTVWATWINPNVEGTYYINISIDKGDNVNELNESNNIFILVINVTNLPVTTINAVGEVYFGSEWYINATTELNLTPISGIPPIYTWYRILYNSNGTIIEDWTNYTGNLSINLTAYGEDAFRIEFNSTDSVPNSEDTKSRVLIVDNSSPETSIDVGDPKYNASMGDILNVSSQTPIDFTSIDYPQGMNASGVKNASGVGSPTKPNSGIFYNIENATFVSGWMRYQTGVSVYLSNSWADGMYVIYYNATDNLGNMEIGQWE
jgi:hypothetical protein